MTFVELGSALAITLLSRLDNRETSIQHFQTFELRDDVGSEANGRPRRINGATIDTASEGAALGNVSQQSNLCAFPQRSGHVSQCVGYGTKQLAA